MTSQTTEGVGVSRSTASKYLQIIEAEGKMERGNKLHTFIILCNEGAKPMRGIIP